MHKHIYLFSAHYHKDGFADVPHLTVALTDARGAYLSTINVNIGGQTGDVNVERLEPLHPDEIDKATDLPVHPPLMYVAHPRYSAPFPLILF